jgi:hypothetical protein
VTLKEIIVDGDNGKQQLKDYLKDLLLTMWREGESFSGKRPFGNSGWQYDVYQAMIKHKHLKGKLDEDGYVDECDTNEADAIIENLIHEIFE